MVAVTLDDADGNVDTADTEGVGFFADLDVGVECEDEVLEPKHLDEGVDSNDNTDVDVDNDDNANVDTEETGDDGNGDGDGDGDALRHF